MRLITLLFTSLTLLISVAASANVDIEAGEYVVFYHHDVLGSPVTATNEQGQVIWHERTQPYGKSEGRISQNGNPFGDNALPAGNSRQGYTGHTLDNSAGLTYMKARYYDHNIGRFLSNDPVAFYTDRTVSFNRYVYAGNNPYRYYDPSGEDFMDAYRNPDNFRGLTRASARVAVVGGKTPVTAKAAAAFVISATAAGYGLHKLSVWMSEDASTDENSPTDNGDKKKEKPRFIGEPNGTLVDTDATPQGSYNQPDGGRTDILQGHDNGEGFTHTHEPITNTNPTTGETFVNGVDRTPRPVTPEEVNNIESGDAGLRPGLGR